MALSLDPTERRIVGCLVEKETTVPEAYPLTLNSLVLACNQKSNRDPHTDWAEHFVDGALRSLMDKGWVQQLELAGSRTRRFAHLAGDQLGVDGHDLAILAELLLRGPQSAKELETRAARMRPFASLEEVERRLSALAARPVPYVRLLGKRPGERVPRWEQLIGGGEPVEAASGGRAAEHAAGSSFPRAVSAPTSRESPREAPRGEVDPMADVLDRLASLEREVAALRTELESRPR